MLSLPCPGPAPQLGPRPDELPLLSPPAWARPNGAAIGGGGEATTPTPAGAAWAMNEARVGCARRPERRTQRGGRVRWKVSALGPSLLWEPGPGWGQGLSRTGYLLSVPDSDLLTSGARQVFAEVGIKRSSARGAMSRDTSRTPLRGQGGTKGAAHEGSCESEEVGRREAEPLRQSEREDGRGLGRGRA